MNMISVNRTHQLPLFGHFCCRLAAQPDCVSQESCSGDLMLLDVDAGRQWVFMWGQLQAFRLDLWVKREHWEKGQDPVMSIVVDRVSADLWVSKLCPALVVRIIQGDSRGICETSGNYSMCDSKQKSSYKHVSDFGRLRSYDRFLIPVHALV